MTYKVVKNKGLISCSADFIYLDRIKDMVSEMVPVHYHSREIEDWHINWDSNNIFNIISCKFQSLAFLWHKLLLKKFSQFISSEMLFSKSRTVPVEGPWVYHWPLQVCFYFLFSFLKLMFWCLWCLEIGVTGRWAFLCFLHQLFYLFCKVDLHQGTVLLL